MLDEKYWNRFAFAPSGSAAEVEEVVDETPVETEGGDLESVETEVEEAPSKPSLAEAFKAHNLNLPDDPEVLTRELRALAERARKADELERQVQWYAHQQSQQQAPPQETKKEAAARKKLWDLPQFDRRAMSLLTQDENGNIVVRPGGDPTLPAQYAKWKEAREEAMDKALEMLADPYAFYEQNIQPHAAEQYAQMAAEASQAAVYQYQQQQRLQAFENENIEWVYEKDVSGRPTRQLSPAAQQWNQFYNEAIQYRHNDPIGYATDRLDAILFRSRLEQEAATKDQPTEADKKHDFLAAAARKPNKGGTMEKRTRSTPPQHKDGDKLFEDLKARLKALPPEDFTQD